MGFLSNPAKSARPYLEPIEGYGKTAYNPYIAQGQQVDSRLQSQYENMAFNPTELINAIMSQYQQSPGAKYQSEQLNRVAGNAAAAGGYAGTMGDQRQRAELIQALTSQDMQKWLENALGVQGAGLTGLQGVSNRGYDASGNLADYLGSAATQRAGLEFGGQQAQNANITNLISSLIGGGAAIAGGMAGGGQGAALSALLSKLLQGGNANSGNTSGGQPQQNYVTAPGRYGAPGAFRWGA